MDSDDFVDYYDLLGVEPEANVKEIERAYREKARKCHPDKNPDDPNAAALFLEIGRVKELLSDPESRAVFDRQRTARALKQERFKAMDSLNQKLRTDLAYRERMAEEQAKVVAQRSVAKTVQSMRAENLAMVERVNEEARAKAKRAAAPAPASVPVAAPTTSLAPRLPGCPPSSDALAPREAAFAALLKARCRAAASKRRRTDGPSCVVPEPESEDVVAGSL